MFIYYLLTSVFISRKSYKTMKIQLKVYILLHIFQNCPVGLLEGD